MFERIGQLGTMPYKIAEYFMSLDKEVHIIELGEQDPSEMGHDKFQDLLNQKWEVEKQQQ